MLQFKESLNLYGYRLKRRRQAFFKNQALYDSLKLEEALELICGRIPGVRLFTTREFSGEHPDFFGHARWRLRLDSSVEPVERYNEVRIDPHAKEGLITIHSYLPVDLKVVDISAEGLRRNRLLKVLMRARKNPALMGTSKYDYDRGIRALQDPYSERIPQC